MQEEPIAKGSGKKKKKRKSLKKNIGNLVFKTLTSDVTDTVSQGGSFEFMYRFFIDGWVEELHELLDRRSMILYEGQMSDNIFFDEFAEHLDRDAVIQLNKVVNDLLLGAKFTLKTGDDKESIKYVFKDIPNHPSIDLAVYSVPNVSYMQKTHENLLKETLNGLPSEMILSKLSFNILYKKKESSRKTYGNYVYLTNKESNLTDKLGNIREKLISKEKLEQPICHLFSTSYTGKRKIVLDYINGFYDQNSLKDALENEIAKFGGGR